MKCDRSTLLLYAVTDRAWSQEQGLHQQVEQALRGGVTCVQLREKALEDAAFLAEARDLAALCKRFSVPFLVNDRVDIALACDADGVHVGQEDLAAVQAREQLGPDKLLGVSVHTVEEALQAEADGADYLGVGAMFPTPTKPDAKLVSLETLRAICSAVSIPVVAIGGIEGEHIPQLTATGVAGVALVHAIFSAPNIEKTCSLLRQQAEQLSP